MNVRLKVEEDAELRSEVKDLIRGMIKSITTEEMREMLKGEMERRVRGRVESHGDFFIDDELRRSVREIIQHMKYGDTNEEQGLRKIVKKECQKLIDDYLRERSVQQFATNELRDGAARMVAASVSRDDVVKAAIQMLKSE